MRGPGGGFLLLTLLKHEVADEPGQLLEIGAEEVEAAREQLGRDDRLARLARDEAAQRLRREARRRGRQVLRVDAAQDAQHHDGVLVAALA